MQIVRRLIPLNNNDFIDREEIKTKLMYFCYVDESGDTGKYDTTNPGATGTRYFILSAVIVNTDKWKLSLDTLKSFRKQLAAQAYLNYDVEFHCAEMIDPRKQGAYQQLSIADRWKLINMFAETIVERMGCNILAVVIDKTKTHLLQENYFTSSITALYQAYDEFLRHEKANGLVLFDRANEKVATTHVRKLMSTGATGQKIPGVNISWVIEDPIYRVSADSFFIQAADLVAYTLKEQEFPIGSRKKYNADRIFKNLLQKPCLRTSQSGHDGVIRL